MTQENTIATTTAGQIRGRVEDDVCLFSGVPYGQAARFRPPAPVAPWQNVRDATTVGPRAIQTTVTAESLGAPKELIMYFSGGDPDLLARPEEAMDENCLFLNILTPRLDDGARPVLVYVHGGGFDSGTGAPALMGTRLAREEDVVVVGVNHRLNAFGFLHLADLDADFADACNVGMLDLVLALEWLRDNIARFGGDPTNITLFGESGGGMKISTLLAMPAARGLFHKAIVQSGPFLDGLTTDVATDNAQRLLDSLNAKTGDLASMPARQLFDAAASAQVQFAPVVDGHILPRSPFQPDAPDTAEDVPLIIGHTFEELSIAFFRLDDATLASLSPVPEDRRDQVDAAYAEAFTGLSARQRLYRIISDLSFGNASRVQADRKAAQPVPVYKYVIGYQPPILDRALGAFHGMDVPMVLRACAFPETETFSKTMAAAWAAFARTGDPSTPVLGWPRYDPATRVTMILDDTPKAVTDPDPALRALWGDNPATQSVFQLMGKR